MLKILQVRLQQNVNWELPDVQTGFRKGRGTRDQIANIHWIIEKAREFQKNKAFDWVDHNKLENSSRDGSTRLPYLTTEKFVCRSRSNKPDVEQWTGSKLGKEYVKAVYCHPAYLTYMQSTSCKMLGWMKHKLESRLPGEISITWYTDDIWYTDDTTLWQKAKRTKECCDENERRVKKLA